MKYRELLAIVTPNATDRRAVVNISKFKLLPSNQSPIH